MKNLSEQNDLLRMRETQFLNSVIHVSSLLSENVLKILK